MMHRTFISGGSLKCLSANGYLSSKSTSDLTSKTFTRSFGKHKTKKGTTFLLDPQLRADRLKAAGEQALQAKYERNAYNKRYRERRQELADKKKEKDDDKKKISAAGIYMAAIKQPAKDAMKAMKEDWELGPLAPRRDVGEMAGRLGTVDMGLHHLHPLSKRQKEEVKKAMGDNEFRVHDRVVVLTGRDRGKIGQILEIDEENLSATIDGINKIPIHVPKYMAQYDSDDRDFRVLRRNVRLHEIRLVCPIRDPDTQKVREVILDRMDLKKVLVYAPGKTADIEAGSTPLPTDQGETIQRESKEAYELEDYKWKTIRYIPGTTTEIVDHSEIYDEHNYDAEYGPDDTLLVSVHAQTYWPEIIEHPMPPSVLKEISLKGRKEVTKFSEKIEDSIREKAEAKARKQFELQDKIRTPLQELKQEIRKVQREALRARRAEFIGPSDAVELRGQNQAQSPVNSYEKGEVESENSQQHVTKPQPVSDVMIQIGRAMAINWAKNPNVVTGNRRRLLDEVLEQEVATTQVTGTEARV
ncbi:uncharacterized protein PV09_03851 [Verruconis gallopava]|uniref:KOW domain-containing protein n=1 Tax=Verruconis gallopava TaxID=253628 RepID=A0A0D1YX96_9PEZI|nr:uncharacterized protein PV09_03851 [Verruconis gallopava]KIW05332.1 hypothetical protein PV09_03851 [Verruconis gallopava]